MSRNTRVLLALGSVVVIAVVALFLTNRERTRNANVAKPPSPPAPHAKVQTPTPPPPTPPTPPATPTTTTTTRTPTSTASPVVVVVAPPAPPANEDGVALLPSVKPPATPAVDSATDAASFLAFAPGGRLLVARASDALQFVDLATGQRQAIEMKLASPRAVALSPAGDRIAVANAESADVWHVASSRKTHLGGGDVTAIRFARGGQLFTGHAAGEVKIWATPSWTSSTTLRPNVGGVTQIAESPSSAQVAVIGASGGIAVCDVGESAVKQRLGRDQAWTAVAFAPDGRTIAAAGAHGVAMWDTMLWQPRPAPGGSEPVTHVAFWRGGTVLVTASADGAIRIYDLATRQLMTTLTAKGPIVSLDLADDGRTIAASDANGIAIWDSTAHAARQLDARP